MKKNQSTTVGNFWHQGKGMKKPKLKTSEMVAAVVCKYYMQSKDFKDVAGSQRWNGEWWVALSGCYTLSNMLEDLAYAIERRDKAK